MSDTVEEVSVTEYERRLGLWLDVLESGVFVQGSGQLRSKLSRSGPDRYCCLGLACDIWMCETGDGTWAKFESGDRVTFSARSPTETGGQPYILPKEVSRYFGLRTLSGEFEWDTTVLGPVPEFLEAAITVGADPPLYLISLTSLNDGDWEGEEYQSYSFADIAAVLRARPKGLFTWT